jgi:uncharacterized membrane protein YccC
MAPAPRTSLLRNIIRFDRSQLSMWMGLRNAMGVALALLAGVALHNVAGGAIAATGALDAALSDGSDPYLHRARRMLTATAFVALAVFAGRWSGENHALAVTLGAACALSAGMVLAIGQTAGDIGVITLVTLIVFAAQPAPFGKAVTSGALIAVGGLLQTLLSIALWPVRRFAPERRALANLYEGLTHTAKSEAQATEPPPATEAILAARTALSGLGANGSVEAERYLALFSQAERIRLALLTLSRLRTRIARDSGGAPDATVLAHALGLAAQILSSIAGPLSAGMKAAPQTGHFAELRTLSNKLREPAGTPSLIAMRNDARRQIDALSGQLRVAIDLAAHTTTAGLEEFQRYEAAKPRNLRLAGALAVLRANLTLRSAICRHAIRLAVCVALADFIGRGFHSHRAYWAPMTAMIVLKPDFTTTVTRSVLRFAGTFAGLALSTAVFAVFHPALGVQIALIAFFMFVMRWAGPANYGVLVLALTALVVLLFATTGIPPGEVIAARALNTAIGGALALAAAILWPTWERGQIPESMARLLDAYREYFQAVRDGYLHPGAERDPAFKGRLDRARQNSRLARSNLEASVGRFAIEPGATAERVTALRAILANSHRFIHAVMALEAGLERSAAAPPRAEFVVFTNQADATLYFLSAYLRGAPLEPGDLPDLRESHRNLIAAGDNHIDRYALVNVETDRVTNSLNTLAIELVQWLAAG